MAANRVAEVEKLRKKIDVLKQKIEDAQEMRAPVETAYQRADQFVDSLAEEGVISGGIFDGKGWAYPNLETPRKVLELIAWVDPEKVKQRLRSAIDDHYREYTGNIDTPEAHASIKADKEALFKLEIDEERLIQAAEAEGMPMNRRRDANPRAVLAA